MKEGYECRESCWMVKECVVGWWVERVRGGRWTKDRGMIYI